MKFLGLQKSVNYRLWMIWNHGKHTFIRYKRYSNNKSNETLRSAPNISNSLTTVPSKTNVLREQPHPKQPSATVRYLQASHTTIVLVTKSRRLGRVEWTLPPWLLPYRDWNVNYNRGRALHESQAFAHCAIATVVPLNLPAWCDASLTTPGRVESSTASVSVLQALRSLNHRNNLFIQLPTYCFMRRARWENTNRPQRRIIYANHYLYCA